MCGCLPAWPRSSARRWTDMSRTGKAWDRATPHEEYKAD